MSQMSEQIAKALWRGSSTVNGEGVTGEGFAKFLIDYVISGATMSFSADFPADSVTVSEGFISFRENLYNVQATTLPVPHMLKNATLYVDFVPEYGFTLAAAHPTVPYLPLHDVVTDGTGNVVSSTDRRGSVGGLQFRPGYTVPGGGGGGTSVSFADITGKPTTLTGYGVTSATDSELGARTANPNTLSGYSNTGTFTQLFSWITKQMKAIVGLSNWYDTPPASLNTLNTNKANLDSPTLTGTPAAPTAAVNTNTTQIATTAFVVAQGETTTAPPMDGTATPGAALKFAKADHVHPTDTSRAPLASPGFSGTPTAPTAAVNTNSTQLATTAFVVGQAGTATPLASGTPVAGTSLKFAREDHVHPVGSVTGGAPLESPAFTGTPTAPTAATGTNSTQIATTQFVQSELATKTISMDSPHFTGLPTAPTAESDTATTQIATTAFVINQAGDAIPSDAGLAAVGTSLQYAREDHIHPTDTTRAPLDSPAFTGTPTAPNPPNGDISGKLVTTDWFNKNSLTSTTGNITLYVDVVNGSDANDGLAAGVGRALASLTAAIAKVPRVLKYPVVINVASGTYSESVYIEGFSTGGGMQPYLQIQGDNNNGSRSKIFTKTITVRGNSARILLDGITSTATGHGISVFDCNFLQVTNYVNITASTGSSAGLVASRSTVSVRNPVVSNRYYGFWADDMSRVYVYNAQGTGNSVALDADNGSIIHYDRNSTLVNSATDIMSNYGGSVFEQIASDMVYKNTAATGTVRVNVRVYRTFHLTPTGFINLIFTNAGVAGNIWRLYLSQGATAYDVLFTNVVWEGDNLQPDFSTPNTHYLFEFVSLGTLYHYGRLITTFDATAIA